MSTWTFWDYVESDAENPIEGWLNSFPDKTRSKIKAKLVAIFAQANAVGRLTEPRYEKLEAPHQDLIRIGFERDKIRYCVFACHGRNRGEIWLLAAGKESNDRYEPPGVLDTALNRRASILEERRKVEPTCLLESN